MKVLITGGSGLIGSRITQKLLDKKIEVVHLTRALNSKFGIKTYRWDWRKKEIDENSLNGVTDIIHLAGAGIADKPWTMARKHTIIQSRVYSAKLLLQKAKEKQIQLNSYISASGIGYYGAITTNHIYTETDHPHNDFVAKCCIYWEKSADKFSETAQRVVKFRTGVVLDKEKGALPKMSKYVNRGLGSAIGTGKQQMPWIHIEDIANLYIEALFNPNYQGVYNAVSPQCITNKKMIDTIAKVNNKKIIVPKVPTFVLKGIYGELADIILNGSCVSAQKVKKEGFTFKYSEIESALKQIYSE